MSSKAKLTTILVTLSLIVIVSMGILETFLIESHFKQSLIDQLTVSAEQLAVTIADLHVPAENNETCQDLADWIHYNIGVRVLITGLDKTVVVDSSAEESLVGEVIESDMITVTTESGEVNSFDLPIAGKDEVGISAPWKTGEDISGTIIIVGPLKAYAREATGQLWPLIRKSGLGALLIAAVGAYLISTKLSKSDEAIDSKSVVLEPSADHDETMEYADVEITDQSDAAHLEVTEPSETIEHTDAKEQTKTAEHADAREQSATTEQAETAEAQQPEATEKPE